MSKINMVTYCCPKDIGRLREESLRALVESHKVDFDEVFVIQQNCRGMKFKKEYDYPCTVIETEDYPNIREEFGIKDRPIMTPCVEGINKYHWKNHCECPLIGLKVSKAEHTIFCDCDIIIGDVGHSWVPFGMAELNDMVIMASPGHGQGRRYDDKPCSQMCFMCKTKTLRSIEYELVPDQLWDNHDLQFEGRLEAYNLRYNKRKVLLGPEHGVIKHYEW